MAFQLTSLAQLNGTEFDDIIDVRSPSEFAEDHIPGAISLPVLSDAERAEVGTIYVQDDRFKARKIGAALVAKNAARHLETTLAECDGSWRPLVYCWRGGQRSGSFASIMAQIGWRVATLEGGYKSYRSLVVDTLYNQPLSCRLVLLDGNTGTGKTALLRRLGKLGRQVIDLEGLAGHRGSILGDMPSGQPSQKSFESALALALTGVDPGKPLVLEAESNKIGERLLPPSLWASMRAAPRLRVTAPIEARAAFLVRAYGDLIADIPRLLTALEGLVPHQGRKVVDRWKSLAEAGEAAALAAELIELHYDPRYQRAAEGRGGSSVSEINLKDLSEAALENAAQTISEKIDAMTFAVQN